MNASVMRTAWRDSRVWPRSWSSHTESTKSGNMMRTMNYHSQTVTLTLTMIHAQLGIKGVVYARMEGVERQVAGVFDLFWVI
jgi:hypothetical protein